MAKQLEEVWVQLTSYPKYEVSSYGRVGNVKTGRELKQVKGRNGYHKVSLYTEGKETQVSVHRLVAAIFLPDYSPELAVKHKNEFLHDNAAANLQVEDMLVRTGPPVA